MAIEYTAEKTTGAHYTPTELARFVAERILAHSWFEKQVSILDPAMGDGSLLEAICTELDRKGLIGACRITGFDTNPVTYSQVSSRLIELFPGLPLDLHIEDFLAYSNDAALSYDELPLFETDEYDLIIANPPYVRTQVLGAAKARALAEGFGLEGRVDLSSAFLVAMGRVLKEGGVAGVIVSNRFMKTIAGAPVRKYLTRNFHVLEIWDFGDTKLFSAAVLPVVLILKKCRTKVPMQLTKFSAIYTTNEEEKVSPGGSVIHAIRTPGRYRIGKGPIYRVDSGKVLLRQGDESPWRLSTDGQNEWLDQVHSRTAMRFGEIGKIRVGVKTTADSVFIDKSWASLPPSERPELVRPLITHHGARRWKMRSEDLSAILYTHEIRNGKRQAVDLGKYPRSRAYLQLHFPTLSQRGYVAKAGRRWYEIWVPQDPACWTQLKIVFRDICKSPTFWMDLSGAIVNGDCYWFTCEREGQEDLLWLALGIANSRFIEKYYDRMFNNKLYAGRRRFMTQYVEQFPLCDPGTEVAAALIDRSRSLHERGGGESLEEVEQRENLIERAFGVDAKS